jgi:hypothetical protein
LSKKAVKSTQNLGYYPSEETPLFIFKFEFEKEEKGMEAHVDLTAKLFGKTKSSS